MAAWHVALLLVLLVAHGAAGGGSESSTNEGTSSGIAVAEVVAQDSAETGTDGTSCDSSALGIRASGTAHEEKAKQCGEAKE